MNSLNFGKYHNLSFLELIKNHQSYIRRIKNRHLLPINIAKRDKLINLNNYIDENNYKINICCICLELGINKNKFCHFIHEDCSKNFINANIKLSTKCPICRKNSKINLTKHYKEYINKEININLFKDFEEIPKNFSFIMNEFYRLKLTITNIKLIKYCKYVLLLSWGVKDIFDNVLNDFRNLLKENLINSVDIYSLKEIKNKHTEIFIINHYIDEIISSLYIKKKKKKKKKNKHKRKKGNFKRKRKR